MRLVRLKLKNFRSFGHEVVEIRFGDGVNLVVGENNVGKSTILRACDLLKAIDESKPGFNLIREDYFGGDATKELSVEVVVRLDESEVESFFSPFVRGDREKRRRMADFFENEINFGYSSRYRKYLRIGTLYFLGSQAKLVYNLDEPAGGQPIEWEVIVNKYLTSKENLSLSEYVDKLLRDDISKPSIHLRFDPCEIMRKLFVERVKNFSEIRQSPEGTNEHVLESYDGRQVADVLFTLKNGNGLQRRRFEAIKGKFNELFPNLRLEVTKEEPGSPPKIMIENASMKDFEIPIGRVGAGIGEIIIFLTHLLASRDMIFGLDMPELHFHPHAQRLLKNVVDEHREKDQFVVITHSPTFVDLREVAKLAVVREKAGRTVVSQIPPNFFDQNELQRLPRVLRGGNTELFFSRGVLVVEGPTEVGAMPIFAESLVKGFDVFGVSVVEGGTYFGILIKLLKGFSFPHHVMCDRDALMNIQKSIQIGTKKVKTSPVLYDLWLSKSIKRRNDQKIIADSESKIQSLSPSKLIYPDSLFESLKGIALRHSVQVLPLDFEGILERDGYGRFLKEAKRMSNSKVTIGEYVAEKIVEGGYPIPKEFSDAIREIVKKSSSSTS